MFDFNLKPGENQWQYKWRVYQAKQNGLIDMDWEELSAKIDAALRPDEPRFNESVYRKECALLNRYWEQVFLSEKAPNLQAEMDKLYKAKRLLADQRREYNKVLVSDARAEHLGEEMLLAVKRMNEDYPLLTFSSLPVKNKHREAALFISDVHYGMVTDNAWNQYNVDIAKNRIAKVVQQACEICKEQSVYRLHVILLGDMIHGLCKVSCRVAAEENVVEQLIHVSEVLAQAIDSLSAAVNEVRVYSTYGNHARMVHNKSESIHAENMERFIPWWLAQRLQTNARVKVCDNNIHEFVVVDICHRKLVAAHGDLDNSKNGKVISNLFNRAYGICVDYFVMGDKHHVEVLEQDGIECSIVGSLCGTDEYANTMRLYSQPSQSLMIFSEKYGKECTYQIKV